MLKVASFLGLNMIRNILPPFDGIFLKVIDNLVSKSKHDVEYSFTFWWDKLVSRPKNDDKNTFSWIKIRDYLLHEVIYFSNMRNSFKRRKSTKRKYQEELLKIRFLEILLHIYPVVARAIDDRKIYYTILSFSEVTESSANQYTQTDF